MGEVRCAPRPDITVGEYLRDVADELATAVKYSDVPFDRLVRELGLTADLARVPLTQLAFAVHDELVPQRYVAGDVEFTVHASARQLELLRRWGTGARSRAGTIA